MVGAASCGGTADSVDTTGVNARNETSTTPAPTPSVPLLCGTAAIVGPEAQMDWGAKSFGTVTATAFVGADGSLCGASATWNATLLISEEITSEAIPLLNARATKAHSADVNAVSGATATSQAYSRSLQAALDRS